MWEGFDERVVALASGSIFIRSGGHGRPLLLLHGFPETHLMWRDVAPRLMSHFTVVCADLRGYGRSGCPASAPDHAPYSKRAMAAELVALMRALGHERFLVAGHDRGGRVAYRMALDCRDAVSKVAVLDVVATADAWDRADARFALGFWPWVLLAQAEPLPERLILAAPHAVIENVVAQWGSSEQTFPKPIQAAYASVLSDPQHVHAICEEYRAGATIDREHDADDRAARRRIDCPLLALWSGEGPLARWYEAEGGPLGLWRHWAVNATGAAVRGGHFFPEEYPAETANALRAFFAD